MSQELQYELSRAKEALAAAERSVKMGEALRRLRANPDFQEIIMDQFCLKEAARYVQISTESNMAPEARADALGCAQASGYLLRWFEAMEQITSNLQIQHIQAVISELEARLMTGEE